MVIKLLDQAGHEGMLQLVLCRVGMHSVLLDMVKLPSLLLRCTETLCLDIMIILICISFVCLENLYIFHYSSIFFILKMLFFFVGQELKFYLKA